MSIGEVYNNNVRSKKGLSAGNVNGIHSMGNNSLLASNTRPISKVSAVSNSQASSFSPARAHVFASNAGGDFRGNAVRNNSSQQNVSPSVNRNGSYQNGNARSSSSYYQRPNGRTNPQINNGGNRNQQNATQQRSSSNYSTNPSRGSSSNPNVNSSSGPSRYYSRYSQSYNSASHQSSSPAPSQSQSHSSAPSGGGGSSRGTSGGSGGGGRSSSGGSSGGSHSSGGRR